MAIVEELKEKLNQQEGISSGLTSRAILIGLLLVVMVSIADPYSLYVVHSSLIGSDYMPVGSLFPFFIVVLLLNLILKAINRRYALTPSELIVIFMMVLVGSSIPTYGLSGYLIAVISAPYFFASPENQWAEYIHPYIPDWLIPSSKGNGIKWFFDGLPPGEKIPWGIWVIPLFWWLSLLAVVMFVCLCLVVILRKQWVENEKLLFPLIELPMDMVEDSDDNRLKPLFTRDRLFWIGFIIPLVLVIWNMGNYFSPFIPQIPIGGWGVDKLRAVSIARDFPDIFVNIYPPIIGFSYLMNLDILFSFWFFHLLGIIQIGIYAKLGYSVGAAEHYSSEYDDSCGWISQGAFVVMVLWSLWMARRHLKDVFRKALGRDRGEVDDSNELFSYRKAVIGLILGTIYIVCWLKKAGMNNATLAIFLPAAFFIYIGVTRIITEGGIAFARGPMVAQTFTSFSLGTGIISTKGMSILALSYAGFDEIKTSFMPAFAHSAKLSEKVGNHGRRRLTIWVIVLSVIVAVFVSIVWTIYLGYKHGAYNFSTWIFTYGAKIPYEYTATKLRNPFGPDLKRLAFFGIGGIVMMILTFLRSTFPWWPLHPIGLTLFVSWPIKMTAFSLFLGWLSKWIIVRLGGIQLYRKARPLFFGLILGYFTGVAISNVVDLIWFTGRGHWLYGLY